MVSPDGKLIAFQGFPAEGPSSYHASDLYTIAPDGSGMTLRTAGTGPGSRATSPGSADGKGLYFTARRPRHQQPLVRSGSRLGAEADHHRHPRHRERRRHQERHRVRGAHQLHPPARRGPVRRQEAGRAEPAHRRERRPADRHPARRRRGDLVHLERRRQDPGLGGQAAVLRSVEEVSADLRDSRRAARGLQHRIQFLVPELRGQRLRGALHQSAGQHRVRHRVRQRDHARLSRRRLRRPDGRRRYRDRAGLHQHLSRCTWAAAPAAACSRAG